MIAGFLAIICAYLLGSIPFGFLLTKFVANIDIRKEGSGNIGATNVLRIAGKKLGLITFSLDFLKGILALIIATKLFSIQSLFMINFISLMVVLGHVFPVWLHFKGGKAVASFAGILLYSHFSTAICLGLGWYAIFYITRISSLASIISAIAILLFFLLRFSFSDIGLIVAIMLILFKHLDNAKRIMAGEEHRFQKNS